MNIGMIIYSQTGHTLSVAMKLKDKLAAGGHAVTLEQVKVIGEARPGMKDIRFETRPDPGAYDALVFGSWVLGLSLTPAMSSYLSQVANLQGKRVACLITHYFPFAWMGGNRAIGQMKRICESKGATVIGSGVVNWSNPRREQEIAKVVDRLSKLF
jgi:flavodoxin